MKRLIILAVVLVSLMCMGAVSEETISIQPGVIGITQREMASYKTRALIEELDVAYLEVDSPYLTKGQQVRFTVHATGGDGIYTYNFTVFRRDGMEGLFYQQASSGKTRSNHFYFTPKTEKGQYILAIRITDAAGSYIEWQSQVYESNTHACAEKARQLADQCLKSASTDYARALWLHDWLIYNADYDYSYQYYYPDGVLLYGKGVCQSYALAYEMLLKLVGIESVYVTGWAGGGSHGWNLVKIDSEWFHIDCTWDDPEPGKENHSYFCVPDSVMLKDHMWRHEVQIFPESEDTDHMYAIRSGVDTCENENDVISALNAALKDKRSYVEVWYVGELEKFDFKSAFDKWYKKANFPKGFKGCNYTIASAALKVEFNYGNGFPDLTKPESMVIDLKKNELETEQGMYMLVLAIPSSADLTGITWSSSNPECISVDKNGYIRALTPGVCWITATHGNGKQAKIELFVNSHMNFIIPENIKVIEESAFADCYMFETVIVPDGVEKIGDYAFSGCALLHTIRIPASVEEIGENAFVGCDRVVIECELDSYAHIYAKLMHLEYRIMSTEP